MSEWSNHRHIGSSDLAAVLHIHPHLASIVPIGLAGPTQVQDRVHDRVGEFERSLIIDFEHSSEVGIPRCSVDCCCQLHRQTVAYREFFTSRDRKLVDNLGIVPTHAAAQPSSRSIVALS